MTLDRRDFMSMLAAAGAASA
ncbi:MAG: hypothetical protein JWP52_1610, partial [Rhizobacter sp.]|nr:hypothetical protein [Rhizobacter sp.]